MLIPRAGYFRDLNVLSRHIGHVTAMTKAKTFQSILNSRPNTQLITFSLSLFDRGSVQMAAVVGICGVRSRMPGSQSREPVFESPLLLFRDLDISVLSL